MGVTMTTVLRHILVSTVLAAAVTVTAVSGLSAQSADPTSKAEPRRPQLLVRATPTSGMVPVRISGTAELKGGDDDFEDYYFPTIEWNWGDGTISESSNDCDPYEPGMSQIRRRYTVTHPYRQSGHYRISFRLKQKDKVVGSAT